MPTFSLFVGHLQSLCNQMPPYDVERFERLSSIEKCILTAIPNLVPKVCLDKKCSKCKKYRFAGIELDIGMSKNLFTFSNQAIPQRSCGSVPRKAHIL